MSIGFASAAIGNSSLAVAKEQLNKDKKTANSKILLKYFILRPPDYFNMPYRLFMQVIGALYKHLQFHIFSTSNCNMKNKAYILNFHFL